MRRILGAVTVACVLVLAGCGGGHVTHKSTTAIGPSGPSGPTGVQGHRCDPANYVMQCALVGQPKPPSQFTAPFGVRFGWDFAWSCPSPVGKSFGASYLSFDTSKNWTRSCVNLYHAHGAGTVAVFETGADRATQGFNAGFNDAFSARSQARGLGEPDNRPIDYAVDCDCSASSIFYYFGGADAGTAAVLHISHSAAVQLVGIYGGYSQVGAMYANHVVGHTNWQTYAWSFGRWQPASVAPLEQYLNSSSVDYDRAIAPDYGQWPFNAAPPGPSPALTRARIAARGQSLHAYYQHGCRSPVLTTGTCGQFAWRVDHYQKLIDTAHGYYPRCFGHDRNLGAAICQIVRPAVATWTRALKSTKKAFKRNNCTPPVGGPITNHLCSVLYNREIHFQGRINGALSKSRFETPR